jgi:hypothetical protein
MGWYLLVRTHRLNMGWFVFEKTQRDHHRSTAVRAPPPAFAFCATAVHAATHPTDLDFIQLLQSVSQSVNSALMPR